MFFKLLSTREESLNKEGVKIVYDDVAPYAKENSFPQMVGAGLFPRKTLYPSKNLYPSSAISQTVTSLKRDDLTYPGYALCYPRFSLLNGKYINFPDEPQEYGYISNTWSNDEGFFFTDPKLIITFNGKFTSVGILLTFNDLSGDYASSLSIEWYEDDSLLSEKSFNPNAVKYFCNNYVSNYNKIVITFKGTSKPYRPVFITRIDYGIYRDFLSDELTEETCIQEINAISEEISVNTLSFTVRTRSDIPFDLQKKQRLGLYFNGKLLGNFYLKNGSRKNKTDYYMDSHDANGVLDLNEFPGGIYTNELVSNVLDEMFSGEDFDYYLDNEFESTTITGYIPYTTKRSALVQIAFAIGAIVDTSNVDGVAIYPQQTEETAVFDSDSTFNGATLEHSDIVTGIRLTVHNYQESQEEAELYNEVLNGTAEIIFSEPYHSLSIMGGAIDKSGSNYAVITGTGSVVTLTGKKYNHLTSQIIKENPDIVFNKSIKEVTDATLINSGNAKEALERIYAYYQRAESVVGDVILADKKLGQVARIDTGYDGERVGTLESIDYSFSQNEIKARIKIHE